MSYQVFKLIAEINNTTYGLAPPEMRSIPAPKPEPKPTTTAKPEVTHPPIDPALAAARAQPMPQLPGLTVGDHLDNFNTWADCNGNSFDKLMYMNINGGPPVEGWAAWSTRMPAYEEIRSVDQPGPLVYPTSRNIRVLSTASPKRKRGDDHECDGTGNRPAKRTALSGNETLAHAMDKVSSSQLKKRTKRTAPAIKVEPKIVPSTPKATVLTRRSTLPLAHSELAYSDEENEHEVKQEDLSDLEDIKTSILSSKKKRNKKGTTRAATVGVNKKFTKPVGTKTTKLKVKKEDD